MKRCLIYIYESLILNVLFSFAFGLFLAYLFWKIGFIDFTLADIIFHVFIQIGAGIILYKELKTKKRKFRKDSQK